MWNSFVLQCCAEVCWLNNEYDYVLLNLLKSYSLERFTSLHNIFLYLYGNKAEGTERKNKNNWSENPRKNGKIIFSHQFLSHFQLLERKLPGPKFHSFDQILLQKPIVSQLIEVMEVWFRSKKAHDRKLCETKIRIFKTLYHFQIWPIW